jgi:chromate reductase, NAD(P)H dehydrogenase (quinone)
MTTYKVGYFVGSLSAASINRVLSRALIRLAPSDLEFTEIAIGNLPLYNRDLDANYPPEATALKDAIAASDAVLFVTPEYNRSIPGPLKNAIDWASRPPNQVFQDKPIAIFSASAGPMGGARVQYDLRRILGQLWGHVLPRPEIFIGSAASKFDAHGRLTDETTRKFLTELLAGFKTWIVRMQRK